MENQNSAMEPEENAGPPSMRDLMPEGDGTAVLRGMKKQFGRIGWTFVLVLVIWMALMSLVDLVALYLENTFAIPAIDACSRYIMLFNEGMLAAAIVLGSLLLRPLPRTEPEKKPFSGGRFVQLLLICFAVSIAGSIIGSILLAIWNAVSGHSVGNTVSEVIMVSDPWQNLLAVGILAPILEELLFRKLLIDRTFVYGEKVSILLSGLLFGLFHMNFSQFFYAFGAGVLLAYLYCRSGKIWLCMLLHAIFNCYSGVLGSQVLAWMTEAMNSLQDITPEAIAELSRETMTAIFAVGLYYMLFFGMAIAGFILFCVKIRRFRFRPGEIMLPERTRSAVFGNAGMIAALIFAAGRMVYSLFV